MFCELGYKVDKFGLVFEEKQFSCPRRLMRMSFKKRYSRVAAPLLNDRDLEFVLYECLDAATVFQRSRYADFQSRNFQRTYNFAIATAKQLLKSSKQLCHKHDSVTCWSTRN